MTYDLDVSSCDSYIKLNVILLESVSLIEIHYIKGACCVMHYPQSFALDRVFLVALVCLEPMVFQDLQGLF